MSCFIRIIFTRLKMRSNTTIRRLTVKLRIARLRVRRQEMLLLLAKREAGSPCEHEWVMEIPIGPAMTANTGLVAACVVRLSERRGKHTTTTDAMP